MYLVGPYRAGSERDLKVLGSRDCERHPKQRLQSVNFVQEGGHVRGMLFILLYR